MEEGSIVIKGARVNNLKDISLEIPRGKLVVITGVSGSGKSSLAFDTLYAEGQRRFAESLSSYARQFLGRMSKPDVDSIEGIPPAIAIEQKVNTRNPRSTVGTTTEIYDYLRLIYARIGRTFSPVSGKEVRCNTVSDVMRAILEGGLSSFYILSDVGWSSRDDLVELMLSLSGEGFSRLYDPAADAPVRLDEVMKLSESGLPKEMYLFVDRVKLDAVDEDLIARLRDSVSSAFSNGDVILRKETPDGKVSLEKFSQRLEMDGIEFRRPDEFLFSFNSPLGACPVCGGLGKIIGISEDLVVPDKTKSIYDGAIACWRGEKMGWFRDHLIEVSERYGIRIFEPWCRLSDKEKDIIWNGHSVKGDDSSIVGINEFFEWVESNRYKIQYKYMLSRYSGRTVCSSCGGSRLRKEAHYVKVGGRTIAELLSMNVVELIKFLEGVELSDYEKGVAGKAIDEVLSRLRYIDDVGLGYLTLSRNSNTLSGGESQRINLVTALGSSLVGSMYILDEPSIGLHPRDTDRLISVLKRLRDIGNTVVVVEHDEKIIRAADLLIDMGPMAGTGGGEVVYTGTIEGSGKSNSLTLRYLRGEMPGFSRKKRTSDYYISVEGAMEHNLKDITVKFPLGVFTVVTGVSGSGKSTLVGDILYPAMKRRINETGDLPGTFRGLGGNLDRITRVEYVDQNPLGKSSRSNAVTYLKVYDDIRKLLSSTQAAKLSGLTPSSFSFNQEGGRCPECQGEGFVRIGMQFMADVTMVCSSCGGKRFKSEVLEVRYEGKNVDDILSMSVAEAIEFFGSLKDPQAKLVAERLKPLADVGLSYIKLGQPSSTLSGGESQRVKLAYFLSMSLNDDRPRKDRILFIFDEPTTGLHFYDVEKLLKAFDMLLSRGHTIVVVEHNTEVIRAADWVIDLGPEAGDEGGRVVFAGTPEDLVSRSKGHTARYLASSTL
ncbi:MAG: excinuclease ABC subunit UvrA [Bacteroidales bacterium]|nr:excinuclease ABC subunit UvrA [Bacteroidales bacterium]